MPQVPDPEAPDPGNSGSGERQVPLRPFLPPSLGDRYDELRSRVAIGPARLVVALAVLLAVGGLGWWMLRPPPAAIEQTLPRAATTPTGATAGGSGGGAGGASRGSTLPGGAAVTTVATQLVVHAAGAVQRPGVYRLAPGGRVDDLVTAAGGLSTDADTGRLNLAAPLQDGERLYVPRVNQDQIPSAVDGDGPATTPAGSGGSRATGSSGGSSGSSGSSASAPGAGPVNLNTASLEQLDTLPGVGPSTAQAIADYRQEHGRFKTVDELLEVRGIGDAKMAQLRPRVTV